MIARILSFEFVGGRGVGNWWRDLWRNDHRRLGGGDVGAFVEIGGEESEVGAVDDVVVVEIALVPASDAFVEIGREDGEVGAIDDAVEVGVA